MESPPGAGPPVPPAPGSLDALATVRDVHFAIRQLNPELERLRKQASLGPTQFWWLVLIVSSFCLGFAYTSYIRTSKLDYPGA